MAVSKVILNGTTLMDVTQKTVTASTLLQGETALKCDGTDIVGTYQGGGSQNVTVTCSTGNNYITIGGYKLPSYASQSGNTITLPPYGAFLVYFGSLNSYSDTAVTGTVEQPTYVRYDNKDAVIVYAGESGGTASFIGLR